MEEAKPEAYSRQINHKKKNLHVTLGSREKKTDNRKKFKFIVILCNIANYLPLPAVYFELKKCKKKIVKEKKLRVQQKKNPFLHFLNSLYSHCDSIRLHNITVH